MQEVDSHRIQQHEFIGTTEEKVSKLIYYAMRQGEGHTALQHRQNSLSNRIEKLEAVERERAITEAREDERDKRLADKLDAMTASINATRTEVDKLKAVGLKAIGVFGSAILLALAKFMISGGLNV